MVAQLHTHEWRNYRCETGENKAV